MTRSNAKSRKTRRKPAKKKKARRKPARKKPAKRKGKKRGGGRPSKYTPALAKKICQLIREKGNTRRAAAQSCGISESTLHKWMVEFPEFSEQIHQADGKAQGKMESTIFRAGKRSYKAAIIWLERRRPAQWGKDAEPEDLDDEDAVDDWTYRTRLSNGDVLVIRPDTTFEEARRAYLQSKRSEKSD